jgi:hypothetical protein
MKLHERTRNRDIQIVSQSIRMVTCRDCRKRRNIRDMKRFEDKTRWAFFICPEHCG